MEAAGSVPVSGPAFWLFLSTRGNKWPRQITGRTGFPRGTRGSGRKIRPRTTLPGTPAAVRGICRDGTGAPAETPKRAEPAGLSCKPQSRWHRFISPVVTCAAWQLLWVCLCSVGASPCPGDPEHGSGLGKADPGAKGLLQVGVPLSVSPVQQCFGFLFVFSVY